MLVRFDTKWREITSLIGVLVHPCLAMESPFVFCGKCRNFSQTGERKVGPLGLFEITIYILVLAL